MNQQSLSPSIPPHLQERLLFLPDDGRSMGIHLMAGRGAGKSRMLGRLIAWLDFVRGTPLVVIDPHGPTIDNFLDKLIRLPEAEQRALGRRVRYIDMAGSFGHVTPWPLYYRRPGESLYVVSQRYLDVVRKLDPALQGASIEGWNALWRIGTYTGMVLAAAGCQITEAEALLRAPHAWLTRAGPPVLDHPELGPALEYFLNEYSQLKPDEQRRRSEAFLTKIGLFSLEPTMRAMFGASAPGIDWDQVVRERQVVLIDFRGEYDIERVRFKMLWTFSCLMDFIKARGAGRHRPISVIVDEISYLLSQRSSDGDLMTADLDELINKVARNNMVWLTLAHQELYQLGEQIQKTLLSMGAQILGITSDLDAATVLARRFYRYRPYLVKKHVPVWQNVMQTPEVIDYTSEEFSLEEQERLEAFRFMDLKRYEFLVSTPPGEGSLSTSLRKVSIANVDRDLYVEQAWVDQARGILARRDGLPVEAVQREITARGSTVPQADVPAPRARKRPKASTAGPGALIHR